MSILRKSIVAVLTSAIWIVISEFLRNEILLKSFWISHYKLLGIEFPSSPLNGALYGVWSLLFSILIFIISRKFSLIQTMFISWFAAFILMWFVLWNMNVLPLSILIFAIPLSLLESFLATYIIFKLSTQQANFN